MMALGNGVPNEQPSHSAPLVSAGAAPRSESDWIDPRLSRSEQAGCENCHAETGKQEDSAEDAQKW